jgi:hypothetical protein
MNFNYLYYYFYRERRFILSVISIVAVIATGSYFLLKVARTKAPSLTQYLPSPASGGIIQKAAFELELNRNGNFTLSENYIFTSQDQKGFFMRGLCREYPMTFHTTRNIKQSITWQLQSVILGDNFLLNLNSVPPKDLLFPPYLKGDSAVIRCFADREKPLTLGTHLLTVINQLEGAYQIDGESDQLLLPIFTPLAITTGSFSLSLLIPASPSAERPQIKLYLQRAIELATFDISRSEFIPPHEVKEEPAGFRTNFISKEPLPPYSSLFITIKLPFGTLDAPYGGVIIGEYANEV